MATFVYTIKEQRTITSLVGKVRLLFRLFLLLFAISMIGLGFLLITSYFEAINSIEAIIIGLLIGAFGGGFPLIAVLYTAKVVIDDSSLKKLLELMILFR
jgi:hypothetical protein